MALLPPAQAAKKKAEPESYALLTGTVFHEPGFALPNAVVTLVADPQQAPPPASVKKLQVAANSRGEFLFRLPPVSLRYIIKASAKGYQEQEKRVAVQGQEHLDVTFMLPKESK